MESMNDTDAIRYANPWERLARETARADAAEAALALADAALSEIPADKDALDAWKADAEALAVLLSSIVAGAVVSDEDRDAAGVLIRRHEARVKEEE